MRCAILAIGNELVSGKAVDTNSAYLSHKLYSLGVSEIEITLVGDCLTSITTHLKRFSQNSDLVITTGGLGPTSDDLTRYAIAKAAGVETELNHQSLSKLENLLKRKGRTINDNNRRQVYFPQGAKVIENTLGTADAFICRLDSNTQVIALPGVPRELKPLIENEVSDFIKAQYDNLSPPSLLQCRIFGIAESDVGEKVEQLNIHDEIQISYRPQFPEIFIEISSRSSESKSLLQTTMQQISDALGAENIVSNSVNLDLPAVVSKLLIEKNLTLAAAESCSGGLLAHKLVSLSGSSEFFLGSMVTYSNKAKVNVLGVGEDLLDHHGAVSEEVAKAMAVGAREKTGADLAVSITGIAGPDGGSEEKPVGTVWIGFSSNEEVKAFKNFLPWSREMIREYSVAKALDIVRRNLLSA